MTMWQDHETEALNSLPIGVLVLDDAQRICYWNDWLVTRTGIPVVTAIGKTLPELFPGLHNPRLEWAIENVIKYRAHQMLSQTLNHYTIPIRLEENEPYEAVMMQQQAHLAPLVRAEGTYVLISILDMTDSVRRADALMTQSAALKEASIRDVLTQVYNRRYLWNWLENQLLQCSRYSYSLACLMIDIDHFKGVNDNYGHVMGDKVLIDFSRIVAEHLRASDILVRYGGEEFVVLAPYCSLADAGEMAQRILNSVRSRAIGGLAAGQTTCSIGVSEWTPAQPCTSEELLKTADARMYQAKLSGRDCVVIETTQAASPDGEQTKQHGRQELPGSQ